MYVTGRAALVGALAALVIGLAVGLLADPPPAGWLIVAANGLLLAGIAADVALAPSPRALAFQRGGDQKVRLGQSAQTELEVVNTRPRRWRGRLRDSWAPSAGAAITGSGQPRDRVGVDLAGYAAVTVSVVLTPTRRGDRPTDRITVRSIGPLGLAGRQGSTRADWSVRTLPPFGSRRHLPSRLARLRDMDGRAAIAVRAQGTEFDSLREYVPGDDVRSIDWRATARADDVMIRTWRPERDRQVVLVLDSGRTSAARIGDETRLDILMDAALLLTALAERAGDRVSVLAHDRSTRLVVSGGTGTGQLPALVDGLALLEPVLVETDYRGLVAAVLGKVRKRAMVVLLVALDRAAMTEGLLPALPALTSRHTVVVAAVRPPAPTPGREDISAAYEAAAQARAAADRSWVTMRLARMGVRVVDAEPDEIAPRLADAYLDLKAAGKL